MSDDGLRNLLLQLSPSARTVLIRDDRGEIAQGLLRYGDTNGEGLGRRDQPIDQWPALRPGQYASLAEMALLPFKSFL